jgi:hypothetical protein
VSWRGQATCSIPSAVRSSPAEAMPRLVSVEILAHFGVTALGGCPGTATCPGAAACAGMVTCAGAAACAAPGNSAAAAAAALSMTRKVRGAGLRMGISSLTWPESFRIGRELSMAAP